MVVKNLLTTSKRLYLNDFGVHGLTTSWHSLLIKGEDKIKSEQINLNDFVSRLLENSQM